MNQAKKNDDLRLIEMLASGIIKIQNKAVKEIYQLHYRAVESTFKDKSLVKEFFPDAVLALQKTVIEGKLEKKRIFPFLMSVCHFSRMKRYKRTKKMPQIDIENVAEQLSDAENTVLEELEREKYVAQFLKAAEQRHERCVKQFKLRFFENKNHKEIAQNLGFKNSNISKTELYRCLKRMRKFLDQRPKWQKIFRELVNG